MAAIGLNPTVEAKSTPKIIDIHAHYLSEGYRAALLRHGSKGTESDGLPAPQWSIDAHLEMMSNLHIDRAFLSLASPHCSFGDPVETVELTREINSFGADIVKRYPKKFSLFATLPLPLIESSLAEINYSFDRLNAVGIKLPTNADGIYLTDERFSPIFDALNQRSAIVVLHPVTPSVNPVVPRNTPAAVVDYLVETTRAVSDMIINGLTARYSKIRWIIPHGGSLLPSIVDRLIGFQPLLKTKTNPDLPDIRAEFAKLYYDVAGFAVPNQLLGLLKMTDVEHILYGSDYPYAFPHFINGEMQKLLSTDILSETQQQNIFADNINRLFLKGD